MITIYIKSRCPYCVRLLALLDAKHIPYTSVDIITEDRVEEMQQLSGENGFGGN